MKRDARASASNREQSGCPERDGDKPRVRSANRQDAEPAAGHLRAGDEPAGHAARDGDSPRARRRHRAADALHRQRQGGQRPDEGRPHLLEGAVAPRESACRISTTASWRSPPARRHVAWTPTSDIRRTTPWSGASSRTRTCAARSGSTRSSCPTARRKPMLSVPRYDFNWQTYYMFKEPLKIPKGSRARLERLVRQLRGEQSNPDPKIDVKWGDQTWEEMQYTGILFSPACPQRHTNQLEAPGESMHALAIALSMAGFCVALVGVSAAPSSRFRPTPGALVRSGFPRLGARWSTVPTFSKDVAPILYKNCVGCHRPGEIGPMSLLTYSDARPHAKAIRDEVGRRQHAAVARGSEARQVRQRSQPAAGGPRDAAPVGQQRRAGGQPSRPPAGAEVHRTAGRSVSRISCLTMPGIQGAGRRVRRVPGTSRCRRTSPKIDGFEALEVRPGNRDVVHHVIVQRPPAAARAASGGHRVCGRDGRPGRPDRRSARARRRPEARARREPLPASAAHGRVASAASRRARRR